MKFDTQINLNQLPQEMGKLPTGTYFASIKTAEVCVSKMNINNEYIKLQWVVLDGAMQDRTCYQNINYRNDNKVAETIGLTMLRKVMSIGQIMSLADTDQLIGIMADIVVEHQDACEKNNFIESANVKDVKHHNGTPTPITGIANARTQAQPRVQAQNPFVNIPQQGMPANNPFLNTGALQQPQKQTPPQQQGPESFIGDDIPVLNSFIKN